jgi:hypothetical protein
MAEDHAYLVLWLCELICKAVFIAPATNNKKLQSLKDASTVKLSIEGVKCQLVLNERSICSVTIRNLSNTSIADNVSVRIDGKVAEEIGYATGFDPFHASDLAPSAGHRSINPAGMADFVFPDSVNEMVYLLTIPGGRKLRKAQTFKLTVSSSTSPAFREEFVIVEKDYNQISIIKNIEFHGL